MGGETCGWSGGSWWDLILSLLHASFLNIGSPNTFTQAVFHRPPCTEVPGLSFSCHPPLGGERLFLKPSPLLSFHYPSILIFLSQGIGLSLLLLAHILKYKHKGLNCGLAVGNCRGRGTVWHEGGVFWVTNGAVCPW